MELTKEYFDQRLKNLVTKDDLKDALKDMATKQDVRDAVEELARVISTTIANPMEQWFARLERRYIKRFN